MIKFLSKLNIINNSIARCDKEISEGGGIK